MQFKVPQFLDIEDKIFGPFTFREFVYLAGGAGLSFVIYKALGLVYGSVPILIVGGLALLLTFSRPNNKPFINILESFFKYMIQNKLYVWERRRAQPGDKKRERSPIPELIPGSREPKLTDSKLRDLAWSLDVLDLKQRRNNNGGNGFE